MCAVILYSVDCEQSLFSSKTVGKTQNKRGSVTVIVTALPLVARSIAAPTSRSQPRSHAYLFCGLLAPRVSEEKRDCSQFTYSEVYQNVGV